MPQTPLSLLVTAAMNEQGLKYETVSRRSGIPVSTIAAYKLGNITGQRANPDTLAALATALGLQVEDVLEAAGAARDAGDEATLVKLFRRLPTGEDRAQAVEALRVHVRFARRRRRK